MYNYNTYFPAKPKGSISILYNIFGFAEQYISWQPPPPSKNYITRAERERILRTFD